MTVGATAAAVAMVAAVEGIELVNRTVRPTPRFLGKLLWVVLPTSIAPTSA
jgi:hypothetical protein